MEVNSQCENEAPGDGLEKYEVDETYFTKISFHTK